MRVPGLADSWVLPVGSYTRKVLEKWFHFCWSWVYSPATFLFGSCWVFLGLLGVFFWGWLDCWAFGSSKRFNLIDFLLFLPLQQLSCYCAGLQLVWPWFEWLNWAFLNLGWLVRFLRTPDLVLSKMEFRFS